ncbi:glycosyltransferase, partial [Micrococcus sp. SIMBA_144]
SARQIGIDTAKGEFFCTVDSDDYIDIDYVKEMYLRITKENSDICVCGIRVYSNEMSKMHGFQPNIISPFQVTLNDIEHNYRGLL